MSLTKQQLLDLNNSSFPNNNAGAITAEDLRVYNSSSIAAFVDENAYIVDSASFSSRINSIGGVTTGSFNQFTQSINAFTASQEILNATFVTDAQLAAVSSSLNTSKVGNSQTSSMAVSSSTYAITASYTNQTDSASVVYIGSDGGDALRYVTFTEGANYQQVRVDTIGGLRYNPSTNTLVGNVISASSAISTSIINGLGNATAFSASVNSRLLAGGGGSSSINTSSFATTGSNTFTGTQQIGSQAAGGNLIVGGNVQLGQYGQYYLLGANGANTSVTSYASQSNVINIGAVDFSAGAWDTELYIESTPSQTTFSDWNNGGSNYNTWLTLVTNDGSNLAPIFNRGLRVTGSTELNTNSDVLTALRIVTGSFAVTSKSGSFYTNLPITSSGARINGKLRAEEFRVAVDFNQGNGNLYVEGNTFLTGALWVSQSATISSSLKVVGTITASGNISSSGNIYAANLTGSTSAITIQDDGTFKVAATAISFGPNLSVTTSGTTASVSPIGLATTGSNTFIGTQTISGSVAIQDGNVFSFGTIDPGNGIFNGVNITSYGTNNANKQYVQYGNGTSEFYLGAIPTNFATDSEFFINVDANGVVLNDWDNNTNAYSPFLHVPYNTGNTIPGFDRGLNVTGSLTIKSGSTNDFYIYGHKQYNYGAFQTNVTQSGSAAVSKSVNFEITDSASGVSIASNSRITIANAGVYQITFSAQLNGAGGSDTIYIWLKKNGSNVAESATKQPVGNNSEEVMTVPFVVIAAANDYYELAWQSTSGNGVLQAYNASGNIPAIPSVILTVTQLR